MLGPPYFFQDLFRWTAETVDGQCSLNEALMSQPDYSVAALVCGLHVARRLGRPTVYTLAYRAAIETALHWPDNLEEVSVPDLKLGPNPRKESDEQVVRVTSEDQLDHLIGELCGTYGADDDRLNCLYRTLEEAGRNALLWSAERVAYVGWAERRDKFEIAVGDAGPGIAATTPARGARELALERVVAVFDDAGRPATGLTRLHQHWRQEARQIEAYIASAHEHHTYQLWNQAFRSIDGAGPTIVWARF